ncbi:MAG: hypothetical protein ACJ790_01130 [Myxococcaceae bacterium]
MAVNRIDPTPVRISTNLSIDRQTPKADFGDRIKAGLDTAGTAVANGAAIAAPFVPGGAIVSAAVSSVGQLSNAASSGQGGAVSAHYASTSGLTTMGGSTGINTTVPSGGGSAPGTTSVIGGGGSGTSNGVNYAPGVGGGSVAQMQADLISAQAENGKLMQVQMQMQRENQVFSTVSNVLKVRHDTVKNTIQNVR